MTNVFFTREMNSAILNMAHELKRMNDLKEFELEMKYGYNKFKKKSELE